MKYFGPLSLWGFFLLAYCAWFLKVRHHCSCGYIRAPPTAGRNLGCPSSQTRLSAIPVQSRTATAVAPPCVSGVGTQSRVLARIPGQTFRWDLGLRGPRGRLESYFVTKRSTECVPFLFTFPFTRCVYLRLYQSFIKLLKVLDRTHLQWFTAQSFAKLAKQAGFDTVASFTVNKKV